MNSERIKRERKHSERRRRKRDRDRNDLKIAMVDEKKNRKIILTDEVKR